VRLFEAAACGVPIISDRWSGIEEFFVPGRDILVADSSADIVGHRDLDDEHRRRIAANARRQVLARHTAEHRVHELEAHVSACRDDRSVR
jgi:spore maturation protein CgeB